MVQCSGFGLLLWIFLCECGFTAGSSDIPNQTMLAVKDLCLLREAYMSMADKMRVQLHSN
uniref:Uncharacterized protein n=1 Tax=Romanomermis culicivorax TaxID=13658 RepID=A0A915I2H7_ROMCU